MNLLGKVRRLHFRDGLSLSEIERRTGLTRKTIRKWLKAPEGVEPGYRRKVGETKIAPFAERLIKMLDADTRRPVRDRRTALKLHAELKHLGLTAITVGSPSSSANGEKVAAQPSPKRLCLCSLLREKRTSSTGAKSIWSSAASGGN